MTHLHQKTAWRVVLYGQPLKTNRYIYSNSPRVLPLLLQTWSGCKVLREEIFHCKLRIVSFTSRLWRFVISTKVHFYSETHRHRHTRIDWRQWHSPQWCFGYVGTHRYKLQLVLTMWAQGTFYCKPTIVSFHTVAIISYRNQLTAVIVQGGLSLRSLLRRFCCVELTVVHFHLVVMTSKRRQPKEASVWGQ